MASIVYFQTRQFTQNRPLESDEKLICEGAAKYDDNNGWIYLTSRRLFFVSHKVSLETNELDFPLTEILHVENGQQISMLLNKLIVELKNGAIEEFVVQDSKHWVNQIKRTKSLLVEAPRVFGIYD